MTAELEKYTLWSGVVLTILSSMLLMAWPGWLVFAPFALGIVMFSWALYRYMGCHAGDERMQRIAVYSMTNSWLSTFFMEAMYVGFVLAGILKYRPVDVLGVTIITMLVIFSAYFLYFSHRGDVA